MPRYTHLHAALAPSRPYRVYPNGAGLGHWHATFKGHRDELHITGSRIEAEAIARCYHALFLAPGAPLAHVTLSEPERLDRAEHEAAFDIEQHEDQLYARLYSTPAGRRVREAARHYSYEGIRQAPPRPADATH